MHLDKGHIFPSFHHCPWKGIQLTKISSSGSSKYQLPIQCQSPCGSRQGQPRSVGGCLTSTWIPSFNACQLWAHTAPRRTWSSFSSSAFMVMPRFKFLHAYVQLTSLEVAVSRLLLPFDEFICFALKCRTPLNSRASWCSSQFLSLPPTEDLLCPSALLLKAFGRLPASWTGELIWLKNNPAKSTMINSHGWFTGCFQNTASVTQ